MAGEMYQRRASPSGLTAPAGKVHPTTEAISQRRAAYVMSGVIGDTSRMCGPIRPGILAHRPVLGKERGL